MQPIPGVTMQYVSGGVDAPVILLPAVYDTQWSMLSPRTDADKALALVKALVPDAQIYDAGLNRVSIVADDPTIKCWSIRGTVADPADKFNRIPIDEEAGGLLDRKSKPRPGIDMIDWSSKAPAALKVLLTSGIGQLYWGNY